MPTKEELARAFNEWLRRFKEKPEEYDSEYPVDGSYGENCADYLLTLLSEQKK